MRRVRKYFGRKLFARVEMLTDNDLNKHVANVTFCQKVILGIISVRLVGPHEHVENYAFLNSGSDTTLIKEDLVRRSHSKSTLTSVNVYTLNRISKFCSNCTEFAVSHLAGLKSIQVDCAFSVSYLPISVQAARVIIEAENWPHLQGVPFPESTEDEVSILIGCNVPEAYWVLEQRIGGRKQTYAIKTLLGWVIR